MLKERLCWRDRPNAPVLAIERQVGGNMLIRFISAGVIVSCLRGAIIAAFPLSLMSTNALTAPVESVIYSFKGGPTDGANSLAKLIDRNGVLYGTTNAGGTNNNGAVFKLTLEGTVWVETVLYTFKGGSDGASPQAGLVTDKQGALYGTTIGGGNGYGTVFMLTPPVKGKSIWTEAILYKFCSQSNCSDGANPYAGLMIRDGILYGTTGFGGNIVPNCYPYRGCGTVFKLTPNNDQSVWTETVLYRFNPQNDSDGIVPSPGSLITDSKGALYGTTVSGGNAGPTLIPPGYGTVFKLSPQHDSQKFTETVIYSFNGGSDGAYPYAGLIIDQGEFYGTTASGGSAVGSHGYGTVFMLTPPVNGKTWMETVIYTFCSKSNCSDGANPYDFAGLTVDKSGAIYGTTVSGGVGTGGTIFKLTKVNNVCTKTVLYGFKTSEGTNPFASLTTYNGALCGTTTQSGVG